MMYPSNLVWRVYSTYVVVLHVIFNLRLLCSAQVLLQDGNVTCDVPLVEPLENTSLRCFFPEDMTQTRRNFSVYRYKEETDVQNIMDCWWWSGSMKCHVSPGYKFISILSHEVTLEIPRASIEYTGTYMCLVDSFKLNDSKTCELGFKLVGKTMCDIPLVARKSITSLTCFFPEDITRTQTGFTVYHYTTWGDKNDVIDCAWNQEGIVCNTVRGYDFDHNVADYVTFKMLSASEDQEGTYSCQIKGDKSIRSETCSLILLRETNSFCHIPSVREDDSTTLTCRFSADVNVTKRNVQVVRVSGEGSEVTILTCNWRHNQLDCAIAAEYEFNNIISDHLVIRIPRASRDHDGQYACHVLGSELQGFKPCPFIIVRGEEAKSAHVVIIAIITAISTAVIFVVVLIIVFCVVLRNNWGERPMKSRREKIPLLRLGSPAVGSNSPPVSSRQDNLENLAKQEEGALENCAEATCPNVNSSVCFLTVVDSNSVWMSQMYSSQDSNDRKRKTRDGGDHQNIEEQEVNSMYVGTQPDYQPTYRACPQGAFSREYEEISLKKSRGEFTSPLPRDLPAGLGSSPPVSSRQEDSEILAEQEEEVLENYVEAAFPDLDSRVYFLTPVHINPVPMTDETVAGQKIWVLKPCREADQSSQTATIPVQDSDTRHDAAMQRVLLCLERMCKQNKEVLVGLDQVSYLRQKLKQGDINVLLIHRHYGFVICKMIAFDGNVSKQSTPKKETTKKSNTEIRNNLQQAIRQLDKAESDLFPKGLRVTKTIAFPNLTVKQVRQALVNDTELTQALCECLGRTSDPADIAGLCLCSDQLSDPKTPWDVSSHVLRELGHWWQRRVAGAGPDPLMTPEMYKKLVARFCGLATTVPVPCTRPPHVSVKTLGQAVWCTGECYTAVITLFPEQLHLLNTAPPTLFVTGPPGTGKTVVLLMTGIKWLRCGHHVCIVSTWSESRAACTMLYHLLLQTVNTQQSAGVSPDQLHLLLYDLVDGKDMEKAVNDLSEKASGGELYVIADEVVSEYSYRINYFQTLCERLLTRVPRLHLWAASTIHRDAPTGWRVEYLTRPLRSPPAVVKEVEQDECITRDRLVLPYSERGVPDHTDGPPVRRLYHRGQGHSGRWPVDCVTCGGEVASFLHSLRVGVTESSRLQWKDVLVLHWRDLNDDSGIVRGLQKEGIPVRVMKDDDIMNVATARSDVVWVASGRRVRGLERKVVVCLYEPVTDKFRQYKHRCARLDLMSRCTSQLVIVSRDNKPPEHD